MALAWVSRHPVVSAPIVGITKPHHRQDAIASLAARLPLDEVAHAHEMVEHVEVECTVVLIPNP